MFGYPLIFNFFFAILDGENVTTFLSLIGYFTFVFGLIPNLFFLKRTLKVPKPEILKIPSLIRPFLIIMKISSKTLSLLLNTAFLLCIFLI